MKFYVLDRSGNMRLASGALEWARFMENLANRGVDVDVIVTGPPDAETRQAVSTIFRGVDPADRIPPRVFETQIFGGPFAEYCERYETRDRAAARHAEIVEQLRNGTFSPDESTLFSLARGRAS